MREWVKGYEERYMVDDMGNVISPPKPNRYSEITLKPLIMRGYKRVGLSTNDKQKNFFIHRLVASAFIPNPNNYPCINHKNGIKDDNRVNNLEWVTYRMNLDHARYVLKTWLGRYGTKKLTPKQVREIRANKTCTMQKMAEKYGVSDSCINGIVNRHSWKDV